MPVAIGTQFIKRGERLYQPLNNFTVIFSAFVLAANIHRRKMGPPRIGSWDTFNCQQLDISIKLVTGGPLEYALNDVLPDDIQIEFIKGIPQIAAYSIWAGGYVYNNRYQVTYGFRSAMIATVSMIFVTFYQTYVDWLAKHAKKYDNWPPRWKFARVIRNSVAHGGRISIEKESAPPVSWYGLTYAYANNGREAIGEDLSHADMIALMFEMDEELNDAGCPF